MRLEQLVHRFFPEMKSFAEFYKYSQIIRTFSSWLMRSECKPKEFSWSVPFSCNQSHSCLNFVCCSYFSTSCWVSHDSRFSLFTVCIDNCSSLCAWDIWLSSIGTSTISSLSSKSDSSRARADRINQISFLICSYRIATCIRCASKISG